MLTSEEVREIANTFSDDAWEWPMKRRANRKVVQALLKDRAEMQAEIERLRAEYAQTLTTIATAISLTADIPNETAAALCRMCNRNLAALEARDE